jgi:hypothetical protein
MTTPPSPPAPDPDDAVVENEWRKIEDARIAGELAEAREEAEPTPPGHHSGSRLPIWQVIALALALAAGIAAAFLLDRPLKPVDPTWPPKAVQPPNPPQETP